MWELPQIDWDKSFVICKKTKSLKLKFPKKKINSIKPPNNNWVEFCFM
ncbi:hypothetical protein [Leptospira noguchii]|nr:hypothetical protein [Leptospira noguchii]